MPIEMIPLSQLKPSGFNPRKSFDKTTIEGLAASIRNDGLLQNFVVGKPKGRRKSYDIISGERRFRALSLLAERGELPKDVAVPAEIRDGLSEEDRHRISTIENVQRENLPPIEEADAVAGLLQDGMALEDVAAKTGLSESTIRRRLALSNLCAEARAALSEGAITLAQAEALTLGSEDQQRELIADGLGGTSVAQIKRWLTGEKASVAMALFDTNAYSGTLTSDLFADDETTYFDDTEQFWDLQSRAVEELAEKYSAEGYDPVEVAEGHAYASWQYRPANEDEKGGVVIEVGYCGRVQVHEGIVSHALEEKTRSETTDNPFAEKRPRPTYSRPVCEYIGMHKSMAVQAALFDNSRIAKEVAVAQMIGGRDGLPKVGLSSHRCLAYFAQGETRPPGFEAVEEVAKVLSHALGKDNPGAEDDAACTTLIRERGANGTLWYEAAKSLSDEQLDRVHLLLTTLCFGQGDCDRLDSDRNSFFNRVAHDLGVDMRDYWTPDEAFLDRRTKGQLVAIVKEAGGTRVCGQPSAYKKSDLVRMLSNHFKRVRTLDKPNASEKEARDWLPDAFRFPAIDPDGHADSPDDTSLDDA